MFYPNTSSYQHKNHPAKKQNRIKISTQQYVRSCTTTVYVNLSMNTLKNSSRKQFLFSKADAKLFLFPITTKHSYGKHYILSLF